MKLSSYFVHKNDVTQLLEEEMIKIYASKIKGKKEGIFFFTQVVHKMLFSWIMIFLAFVSIFKFEANMILGGISFLILNSHFCT